MGATLSPTCKPAEVISGALRFASPATESSPELNELLDKRQFEGLLHRVYKRGRKGSAFRDEWWASFLFERRQARGGCEAHESQVSRPAAQVAAR